MYLSVEVHYGDTWMNVIQKTDVIDSEGNKEMRTTLNSCDIDVAVPLSS